MAGSGLNEFAAASPDLACITDRDATITAANPAWRRVLGWTRRELVGQRFTDLLHEDDRDRARAAFDQVVTGDDMDDLAVRCRSAHGAWRWVSWSMTSGPDQRVYASGRDISGRVMRQQDSSRAESTLRASRDDQLHNVDLLLERDQRKATYLSAVSHELRTPVMIAHGAAETLVQRRSELSPEDVAELEELILTQTSRLSGVITELLDADRVGRAELVASRAPVELVRLVAEAIEASPGSDRISLVAPDEVRLSADAGQLTHIVTNLLENCDKYAPEGTVCVTIDADRTSVRIGVRDQGPGIALSALERVFDPFWRAEPNGDHPGSGVGLALVAEFTRLHGGRAWAEPVERGAHLIVELPVEPPS